MKKLLTLTLIMGLVPTIALAGRAEQCALNSTCSFSIQGKFNRKFITRQLQAGKTYVCNVVRGRGKLLSIQSVYVSKGVTYNLQGKRLNKPFIIRGPKEGTGYIQYTVKNHNDPWRNDDIQFKCRLQKHNHSE